MYPLVTATRANVLPPGRLSHGSTFPSAALPEHNPYTLALLRSWWPGETAAQLAGLTVHDFVHHYAGRHGGTILAAINQVEELPAQLGPRWNRAQRFLGELSEAVWEKEPRLHLLLVIRADFIGILPEEMMGGARYDITPLTRQGALEAVTGPVAGTGLTVADGAAESLVTDLQTSRIVAADGGERYVTADYVEPALLQAVCTRLWRDLPADVNRITLREVRAYADADTALAAQCGRVIAAVADEHDMSPKWLRSWLLDTFVSQHGTREKAHEGAIATANVDNAVLRSLADRHVLTAVLDEDGTRWYRLLSDRLIEPLRSAADQRPPSAEPAQYLLAAEQALALGELGLAKRCAEHTLRVALESDFRLRAETGSLLGNIAHEQDQPAEAEQRYSEAADLFEAVRDTGAVACQLAAVGETQLAQGRLAEAVMTLRAAVGRLPNDPVLQTKLALALWQLGEGRAAVAVLTATLGIDGGNLEALRARGEILADLGDARDAIIDLDRIVGPSRVMAHSRPSTRAARGLALAQLGDRTAARREIESAFAENPWNGPVLYYAARASALSGDEAMARDLARRAVIATDPALSPQHRDIARQLGAMLTA